MMRYQEEGAFMEALIWEKRVLRVENGRFSYVDFVSFSVFSIKFCVTNSICSYEGFHKYPLLREGRVTHRNFMKTSISWNFEVQKCAWNKIILHMVHALFRDPLRGGRDHFTARKFDQIRSRFDQFCDFLAKIVRFEGFSSFVFHLIFKICWNLQYL